MLICADARAIPLRDESVDCCVTSPPYWGLRDYGVDGQIGLEKTPDEYVTTMVHVFREVRRVLAPMAVAWLNLGDSYNTYAGNRGEGTSFSKNRHNAGGLPVVDRGAGLNAKSLKCKDLIGIPWRVALALQADGWWLRSDVIWSKPNPMPESVADRPTKSHEYVFLLSKSERYWYDGGAIREADLGSDHPRAVLSGQPSLEPSGGINPPNRGIRKTEGRNGDGRNARTVWTIPTRPFAGAHFATFPEALARRCILSGCPVGGTVLDPFVGSGTTVRAARDLGREGIGLDISLKYLRDLAAKRIVTTRGLALDG